MILRDDDFNRKRRQRGSRLIMLLVTFPPVLSACPEHNLIRWAQDNTVASEIRASVCCLTSLWKDREEMMSVLSKAMGHHVSRCVGCWEGRDCATSQLNNILGVSLPQHGLTSLNVSTAIYKMDMTKSLVATQKANYIGMTGRKGPATR